MPAKHVTDQICGGGVLGLRLGVLRSQFKLFSPSATALRVLRNNCLPDICFAFYVQSWSVSSEFTQPYRTRRSQFM